MPPQSLRGLLSGMLAGSLCRRSQVSIRALAALRFLASIVVSLKIGCRIWHSAGGRESRNDTVAETIGLGQHRLAYGHLVAVIAKRTCGVVTVIEKHWHRPMVRV